MQQISRADPAPSRLRYRMHRVMLTPLYRILLRVGLPLAIVIGGTAAWFSVQANRDVVFGMIANARDAIEHRPEFMVKLMAIDGASDSVAEDIREILPDDFPVSSFDMDLDAMRDTVVGLDAVESARLRIRQGGVLQVDVVERVPVVVWRSDVGLELLDKKGVHVGPVAHRANHAELPLIVGDGADANVSEALALLAAAKPLWPRLRAMQRIGERRWDVVLDRDQRLLLPESGAVQALERAIAMDEAVDLLERDLQTVDLRLPQRPTLRLTGHAVQEMWQMKTMQTEGN
ncbi:cell division protein FtsQ/DivIB [Puniceibacterium sediminis]|uniref:Cell division protein FtsQ n=1 Tax=Puniceibacterium sediminis TaxID=1608407 RepID=A0A238UX42_9RHOB|nr:cell division protein FtsQ/DivIB [Puniceibacterium sediminis]SNR26586.1 cell division protein FtsQ [Puniceibacterium sediminis]